MWYWGRILAFCLSNTLVRSLYFARIRDLVSPDADVAPNLKDCFLRVGSVSIMLGLVRHYSWKNP